MKKRKVLCAAISAASLLFVGTGMMFAGAWPDAQVGFEPPAQHERAFPSGAVFHTTANPIVNERDIAVPDSSTILMLWEEIQPDGTRVAFYAIGRDGGEDAAEQIIGRVRQTEYTIGLRYANFDPMQALPQVDIELAADEANELYLVQFWTVPLDEFREQIEAMGGKIYRFMPNHTHIVRMPLEVAAQVSQWPQVRWLGAFHTAYKLDDVILSSLAAEMPEDTTARYMIEVFERDATREVIESPTVGDDASGAAAIEEVVERGTGQLRAVKAAVEAMGAVVHNIRPGQFWLEATLTPAQLLEVARMNAVHFIEPWPGPMEMDMDIVRQVGGADYLEGQTAATGQGVRGEVFDSELRVTHQEFTNNAPLIHSPSATPGTAHGTSVYSIIFARGASANARGLLPDADQGIFYRGGDSTYFGGGDKSRLQIAQDLAGAPYNAVFQTSSLGLARTTVYTANSAEMDDVVFMTQVLHMQSQSNAGCCANPRASRPAAWSKNTVSGGAVNHFDTAGRADDTWKNGANCSNPSCGTSIGPAADGRIKPDLCFFFDATLAATRANNSAYTQFGGTSGATPSIAGYMGLFHQMWHENTWEGSGRLDNTVAGHTVFNDR
ncbi:MAG: S8 family serine peptidase, partial [Planctomycetes bacterium]|nr:S8 family serine peptidase [Planctomycetota bacterium]